MKTNQDILSQIIRIITNSSDLESRIPIEKITLNSLWGPELGFDSIALMSLLYELQECYTNLDENDLIGLKTIKDLVEKISSKNSV